MTKERLKEAERLLAGYAQKYGLNDGARDYFVKWGDVKDLPNTASKTDTERD